MALGKKHEVSIKLEDYLHCIIGDKKIGKEQPVSEPVLLKNGWTPIGDVKIGDKIYGEDGLLHNVIGIVPQGKKDVYRVEFTDGTSTRCGLEHLWHVNTKKQRENSRENNDYRFQIKSLEDIMVDYILNIGYKYSIPTNNFIRFEERNIDIDPYLLGLLLGDGGFTRDAITFTNAEQENVDYVINKCKEMNHDCSLRYFENHMQLRINIGKENTIKKYLEKLNLFGCDSRSKFIPKEYIYNTKQVRELILSGIINTDGNITESGSAVLISTYSKQMSKDVAEIARSLGYIVTERCYDRTNENSSKKYESEIEYRVRIVGDYSTLNLSTKHKNKMRIVEKHMVKSICNIEKEDYKEDSVCLIVDNPTHLYITKDYIVTHNSSLIANIAEELYGGIDKLLMLSLRNEKAHEAINGAIYEEPQNWKELIDIVKEFVKGEHDFKMLSFDTIDELIEMAQEEVIRLHTVKYKEVPKSFNACFGGFGEPRKQLMKLINELLDLIKDTGYGYYFVGHNKVKTVKSKLDEEDYTVVGSNLSADYFNAIAYKCPIICNIVSETEKSTNGLLTDKIRYMHFRDNAYIEAGSRFSEMPVKVPYGAKEYIEAIVSGIKASIAVERKTSAPTENLKSEAKKSKPKKEEPKKDEPSVEMDQIQEVESALQELESVASPSELLELIRAEFSRLQKGKMKQSEILDIMDDAGCRMPKKDTDPELLQTVLSVLRNK